MLITFDDVLIVPNFSTVRTRKDVLLTTYFKGIGNILPIMSANMDSVTNDVMANAMRDEGAIGALHRFMSIEDNVAMYKRSPANVFCSIGATVMEYERWEALFNAGCRNFIIDVAHGASVQAADTLCAIIKHGTMADHMNLVVGNFATGESLKDFIWYCKEQYNINIEKLTNIQMFYKVGIGPSPVCSTRTVTGCGYGQISAIQYVRSVTSQYIIADGGMATSGDIAKAFAAGADMVMLGSMLAGTTETPGDIYNENGFNLSTSDERYLKDAIIYKNAYKKYRGSASLASYEAQGKVADHRTPEGVEKLVPYKGLLKDVLGSITAGLASSFSYVGAFNPIEFKHKAKLAVISGNSHKEGLTR